MNRILAAGAALTIAAVGLVACGDDDKSGGGASTFSAPGAIDCGNMFSTMSAISTEGLVALEDDKVMVPNEAVLPLLRRDLATVEVLDVLNGVSAALTTPTLKAMMVEVEVDKKAPDVVATAFVATLSAPAAADKPLEFALGSADFPESQLLAEIYGQALELAGHKVNRNLAIGSRELYYKALVNAEIDILPEYTNSLLSFALRQDNPDARPAATNLDQQIAELAGALPESLVVGKPSSAEDKDVIVCSKVVADGYGLKTLSDLAKVSKDIRIGAPPEFETRAPFGLVGFKEIYGAEFKSFTPLGVGDIAAAING